MHLQRPNTVQHHHGTCDRALVMTIKILWTQINIARFRLDSLDFDLDMC